MESVKRILFRQLFDLESCAYTYLIADLLFQEAVLVDPVLKHVDRDIQLLEEVGVILKYCLETHVHTDLKTGADQLRKMTGCRNIVPQNLQSVYADHQIQDKETLRLGGICIQAISTPGHTDHHFAYVINGDRVLTGDSLLIRECGRTDLQTGNAGDLYESVIQRLFTLSDTTLVYPGHDYRGHSVSTIGEEKCWNPRFVCCPGDPPSLKSRTAFVKSMSNLSVADPKQEPEAIPINELGDCRL